MGVNVLFRDTAAVLHELFISTQGIFPSRRTKIWFTPVVPSGTYTLNTACTQLGYYLCDYQNTNLACVFRIIDVDFETFETTTGLCFHWGKAQKRPQ